MNCASCGQPLPTPANPGEPLPTAPGSRFPNARTGETELEREARLATYDPWLVRHSGDWL